jgi:hypothetical protein
MSTPEAVGDLDQALTTTSISESADDLDRDVEVVNGMLSDLVTSHERYKGIIEDEEDNLQHVQNRVMEAAKVRPYPGTHEKANQRREKNYNKFGEKGSKVVQVVYKNDLLTIEWEVQTAYTMLMAITTLLTGYSELLKVADKELITEEGLEACEALSRYLETIRKHQKSFDWNPRSLGPGTWSGRSWGGRSMRVLQLISGLPSNDSEKIEELESHWALIFRRATFTYRAFEEIKDILSRIKEINDDTMDIEEERQKST